MAADPGRSPNHWEIIRLSVEAIVSFLLVSVVATATPGPAVLYVLSAGISGGLRGYGPGALGILCADLLYFALSMAGLGTFVLASYHLFLAIKWAGAAYLVWLGLRLWWVARSARRPQLAVVAGRFAQPLAFRRLYGPRCEPESTAVFRLDRAPVPPA